MKIIKNKQLIASINFVCALTFFITLSLGSMRVAHALAPQQQQLVQNVINAFEFNDRVAISKLISYPLLRTVPLAPIKNQGEFLARYDEVFDQHLLRSIISSSVQKDWSSIGWQGVVLGNGLVALDPEGNITEINHLSQREMALARKLQQHIAQNKVAKGRRANQRVTSYYNQAVVELTTKNYQIRVDEVGNGRLRYASWGIHKSMAEKPDIVLSNGRVINGAGRNQRFVFDNGAFSYQLNIQGLGQNIRPTGSLEVYKNDKKLLLEVATNVIRK